MKILTFFKSLDFLGNTISFTINSNDTFKTSLGGFISLIIYILYIFFFIFIGKDFIYKINPNGNFQIKEKNQKYTKLKEFKFLMGVKLHDLNFNKINIENYFTPNFTYSKMIFDDDGKSTLNITNLNTIPCDKFEGVNGTRYKSNLNLSEYVCPDISEIKNDKFGGDYTQMDNSSFITFNLLIDESNKNSTKKILELEELFHNKF